MKDPIRLRHDPNASQYCRELLEEGSEGPPDFEYDVQSGFIRFDHALRSEAVCNEALRAPDARTTGARASGRMRRVPRTFFGKLSLRAPVYALISGFAAVAFGGTAAVWIHHQRATMALARPVEAPAAQEPERRPRPVSRPSAQLEMDNDETTVARPKPPAPAPRVAKDARPEAHEDLMLETQDIARLRSVARMDPARAFVLAQEGARKYPQGFFSQEREAIAIRSLVNLGRTIEARARAERFLAAYPRGPAAESIRASVGLSPP
jgi:hypothetical protein